MKEKLKKGFSWLGSHSWGILEILFVAIIPLIVVFLSYGGWDAKGTTAFKIQFSGLILLVVVFLVVKRVWLNPWLTKKQTEMASLMAMRKGETDKRKLERIDDALKKLRCIENAINWFLPLVFLAVAFVACSALENSLVTFTEMLAFIGLSEIAGCACSFAKIYTKKEKYNGE